VITNDQGNRLHLKEFEFMNGTVIFGDKDTHKVGYLPSTYKHFCPLTSRLSTSASVNLNLKVTKELLLKVAMLEVRVQKRKLFSFRSDSRKFLILAKFLENSEFA